MNNRLKVLRKELGLTQQEFADKLKIKRGAIANYEIGRNEPIDAVISLICREFNVNEVWLRTGEGGQDNMFTKISDEDDYSICLAKLTTEENEIIRNTVKYLANANPDKLKVWAEVMKGMLGIR